MPDSEAAMEARIARVLGAVKLASSLPEDWIRVCNLIADVECIGGAALVPFDEKRRGSSLIVSRGMLQVAPEIKTVAGRDWHVFEAPVADAVERSAPAIDHHGSAREKTAANGDPPHESLKPSGKCSLFAVPVEIDDAEWALVVAPGKTCRERWQSAFDGMNQIAQAISTRSKALVAEVKERWDAVFAVLDMIGEEVIVLDSGDAPRMANAAALATMPGLVSDIEKKRPLGLRAVHARDGTVEFALANGPTRTADMIDIPGALRHFALDHSRLMKVAPVADSIQSGIATASARFGLTPAEARIAFQVVSGVPIKSAATALSITEGTARQQLKAVFRKTGVNSQAALVKLILSKI